jgi:hypothetical protein
MTVSHSLLGVGLLAAICPAATSWTSPAGVGDGITYSGGQTQNGLFTSSSPTTSGNLFLFFPASFKATDSQPNISDTLSFVVTADPGKALARISAGLSGDWSILGSGNVSATGNLKVTNLSTSAVLSQSLSFSPTFPTSADFGTFSGSGFIDLPAGWTNAKVELTADLATAADIGGQQPSAFTGLMQLKGANTEVSIQAAPVPLPGALAAAPFAMALAWYARRRMSK